MSAWLLAIACTGPTPEAPPMPPAAPPDITVLPSGPEGQTPVLVPDGDGVLLLWQEPGQVRMARWDDGWSEPTVIVQRDDLVQNWADFPQLQRGGDDALYATWLVDDGGGHFYAIEVGRYDGTAWRSLGRLHDDGVQAEHGFVSLLPVDGGVQAWWLDGRETADGGPMTLRTGRVTADGVQDGGVLDPKVCDCCRTDAVQTPDGAVVLYRDRDDAEVRDIRLLGGREAALHDGWTIAGCPVNGPVGAVSDALYVTWFTAAADVGQVRLSVDGGPPRTVAPGAGEPAVLGRSFLVADETGAVVVWMDVDGGLWGRRVSQDGVGTAVLVGRTEGARSSGFPTAVRLEDDLVTVWTVPGEGLRANRQSFDSFGMGVDVEVSQTTRAMPTLSQVVPDAEGPALVAVWATWCAPCREELLLLQDLHERGVPVLAVSVDAHDRADAVVSLVDELALTLPVVHRPEAAEALGVTALPANALFGPDGTLLWTGQGLLQVSEPALQDQFGSEYWKQGSQ